MVLDKKIGLLKYFDNSQQSLGRLCQNIKYINIRRCIITIKVSGWQPEIFQGRGGLVGLGHFYKYFIKKH